jgi:uncharacterized membrane protein
MGAEVVTPSLREATQTGGVAVPVAVGSSRSVFLDLARAVAILMMLQGHTLHTVLALELRAGSVFYVWSLLRGLTACMFLLLSGFAFTLATYRNWDEHVTSFATIGRRLRRFAFFLLLGYALHFPMAKLVHLYGMSEERWRSFLVVDVLQCIAVMLTLLQCLVLIARTPGRFAALATIGCAAMVALTPAMWRGAWTESLPLALAAYASPATGSLFPLFPWGAYILLGAGLGHLYFRATANGIVSFGLRVLIPAGGALVVLSVVGASAPWTPFGPTDFWSNSPNQFLLRAGLVLLLLAALAFIAQQLSQPPYLVQALAQESLTIYAVHLCIVYGSVWNAGLRQLVGPSLTLLPAVLSVAAIWASMAALACSWHWCKRHEPGIAQWVRTGTAGLLVGKLL